MSNVTELAVCCAVIRRGTRYLVVQRPLGKAEASRWEFPGGKVEAEESDAACIRREIREELGVELVLRGRLKAIYKAGGEGKPAIKLMAFLATVAAEAHPQLHEHQAEQWLKAEELSSVDLCSADQEIAAILLNPTLEAQSWWI